MSFSSQLRILALVYFLTIPAGISLAGLTPSLSMRAHQSVLLVKEVVPVSVFTLQSISLFSSDKALIKL